MSYSTLTDMAIIYIRIKKLKFKNVKFEHFSLERYLHPRSSIRLHSSWFEKYISLSLLDKSIQLLIENEVLSK